MLALHWSSFNFCFHNIYRKFPDTKGGRNSGQRLSPAIVQEGQCGGQDNFGDEAAVPQNRRWRQWALLFFFQGCFNMQRRFSAAAAIQSTTFPELDSVFLVGREIKTWLGRRLEGHLVARSWNQHLRLFYVSQKSNCLCGQQLTNWLLQFSSFYWTIT